MTALFVQSDMQAIFKLEHKVRLGVVLVFTGDNAFSKNVSDSARFMLKEEDDRKHMTSLLDR
jgi:hypothetical protein